MNDTETLRLVTFPLRYRLVKILFNRIGEELVKCELPPRGAMAKTIHDIGDCEICPSEGDGLIRVYVGAEPFDAAPPPDKLKECELRWYRLALAYWQEKQRRQDSDT